MKKESLKSEFEFKEQIVDAETDRKEHSVDYTEKKQEAVDTFWHYLDLESGVKKKFNLVENLRDKLNEQEFADNIGFAYGAFIDRKSVERTFKNFRILYGRTKIPPCDFYAHFDFNPESKDDIRYLFDLMSRMFLCLQIC